MRMRRSAATALIPLLLTIPACASPGDSGPPGPAASAGSAAAQDPDLPAGWRWESYGGVEVGVPGDWGWDNGTQRLTQWCVATKDAIAKPIVGRPGAATLVGCPGPAEPGRDTGTLVAFDRTAEGPGTRPDGDQTEVRLDGVLVTVIAQDELRQRIVETIRRVEDVDSYGCPTTHPISDRPQLRPARPVEVTSLTDVSAVSVCRFGLAEDPAPRLISSLRLDGSAAERAIREIAKAPPGGGPDNPNDCMPSHSYGDDIVVLLVRSAAGSSEIVFRYSGCDHNGFDDGVTVRSLTAAAVAPFLTGPNLLFSFSGGPEKLSILRPDEPRVDKT